MMIFGISLFIPDLSSWIVAVRSKGPKGLSTGLLSGRKLRESFRPCWSFLVTRDLPLRAVESGHVPFDRPVGRSKVFMYLSTGLDPDTQTLDPFRAVESSCLTFDRPVGRSKGLGDLSTGLNPKLQFLWFLSYLLPQFVLSVLLVFLSIIACIVIYSSCFIYLCMGMGND